MGIEISYLVEDLIEHMQEQFETILKRRISLGF